MAPKIANSAAAKKAAAKKAKRKAIQLLIVHMVANEVVATSSQIDTKFSYGVVENTALPEGYVEDSDKRQVMAFEADADKKWDEDDIHLMAYILLSLLSTWIPLSLTFPVAGPNA
ncbi:hypothetical protein EDD85DRAFT_948764 [Armillaria nabsnona]|nr:hypothetical protein EDD85DRAFT_948764 [Armillaria nabsnona]